MALNAVQSIPVVTSSPVVPCSADWFGAAGRSQVRTFKATGAVADLQDPADAATGHEGNVSRAAIRISRSGLSQQGRHRIRKQMSAVASVNRQRLIRHAGNGCTDRSTRIGTL